MGVEGGVAFAHVAAASQACPQSTGGRAEKREAKKAVCRTRKQPPLTKKNAPRREVDQRLRDDHAVTVDERRLGHELLHAHVVERLVAEVQLRVQALRERGQQDLVIGRLRGEPADDTLIDAHSAA